MRADSPLYASDRRSRRRSLSIPAVLALVAGSAALLAILVGLAFAGSQSELAPGTRVAGIDVGGLTKRQAVAKLDSLFEQRAAHPVDFMAATSSYRFAAKQLAVQPDWNAAVAAAGRAGDGFGPVRGFRRLRARVFGAEVLPRLVVSNAALEYALDKIAADVDQRPRSARLVRHGLRIQVVPDQPGSRLDRDAEFAVYGDSVQVVPAKDGLELNVPQAARAILRAATRPTNRVARLTVVRATPERSTAAALAMGIDRRMSSYKTYYSGTSDRIRNLQLGVKALDGTLVAPGGTFSLNDAIGERTIERGFRSAPVIIGNEFAEEVGGGTSQVATTAFNAAWEAGLRITERHPHSLYISRYQLGRDATVYWPSLDLKFANDTKKWVLVKGFAEGDGISIAIYGGETRRIQSSATPLVVTGRAPVERIDDPTLAKGKTVVEEEGSSPSRTTATREIYAADGALIRSETWTTSYEGENRVVRVGTKVVTKPVPPKGKSPSEGKTPAGTSSIPTTRRPSDRLGEPRRHPRGSIRVAIDRRVPGVAVRNEFAVSLDSVLVRKTGSP